MEMILRKLKRIVVMNNKICVALVFTLIVLMILPFYKIIFSFSSLELQGTEVTDQFV